MNDNGIYIRTSEGIEVLDYTLRANLRVSAMNFLEYRQNKQKKIKSITIKGLFYKLFSIKGEIKNV